MNDWTETLTALIRHARIDELPVPILVVTNLGVTITGTTEADTRRWAESLTDATRRIGHDGSLETIGTPGGTHDPQLQIKVVEPALCQRRLFDAANDPYNFWRDDQDQPVRRESVPCRCRVCPTEEVRHGGLVEMAEAVYGYAVPS